MQVGYNAGVQKILIVGSGDIARRVLSQLSRRARVHAVLRDGARMRQWREAGAFPVLAPPPNHGDMDSRTRNLLAALGQGKSLPRSLIYVSTTGVYGDCAGAMIDETRPLNPQSSRAARRVDAECCLRTWGARNGVRVSILRAPGIYGAGRLPIERLRSGVPALCEGEDGYSNHIHADDLAAACLAALRCGRANRAYNVVDDSVLRMGDYFDKVADAFDLPRPPRISRAMAETTLSPVQLSFMRESRRIGNRRLKQELKLRLAYPTVDDGIAEAAARRNACSL